MITLVTGGTGTVGSQVVKTLLEQNQQVRVLSTSKERAASLPKAVEVVIGDLDVPDTLSQAFEGIERVFLNFAHTHTEVQQGYNAIAAAQQAGVGKIVYQSIHQVRIAPEIPHLQSKIAIEEAIMDSGLEYTFVSPNNFYQNDFWFQEAIAAYGIYPQPFGDVGLSRVDVRDIAEVAVKALQSDEYNGQSIPLVGPDALNAADTVRILSEQLGFEVKYMGNDLISWAKQAKLTLPAWKVDDYMLMYDLFQKKGVIATDEELAQITQVLGRAPRSYADFVKEHAHYFSRISVNH